MTTAEIVIFSLALAFTAIVMVPVVRYARERVREAERLADEGWVLVDVNFLLGPIMVPPEEVYPAEIARQIRAEAKSKHAPAATPTDGGEGAG